MWESDVVFSRNSQREATSFGGNHGEPQMTGVQGNTIVLKKWPADDADFTADKIRIRMDLGFDPDFICVEVCEICGPSRCLIGDSSL
jgi:hypothetical protein